MTQIPPRYLLSYLVLTSINAADVSSVSAIGKVAPAKPHSALHCPDFLKELMRLLFTGVKRGISMLSNDEGREQKQLITLFFLMYFFFE